MEQPNLSWRAIAAMVALRSGINSTGRLCDILGDTVLTETAETLTDLQALGLVQSADRAERTPPRAWCLTWDGLGLLQVHGMDATERAKREMREVNARRQAEKATVRL